MCLLQLSPNLGGVGSKVECQGLSTVLHTLIRHWRWSSSAMIGLPPYPRRYQGYLIPIETWGPRLRHVIRGLCQGWYISYLCPEPDRVGLALWDYLNRSDSRGMVARVCCTFLALKMWEFFLWGLKTRCILCSTLIFPCPGPFFAPSVRCFALSLSLSLSLSHVRAHGYADTSTDSLYASSHIRR